MMNTILREFPDHEIVVYLDDDLIYLKTLEEHNALAKHILVGLERHDLTVSMKESVLHWHVYKVQFLGYMVGKKGVTRSEKKVESISNWKAP